MLKHSYSNNILIVNVLIIFSVFVKHLFLYCTAPQNTVTWFWRFINIYIIIIIIDIALREEENFCMIYF